MFYSQFILAKKGPLGTIWIAAHLERKLRKNQIADTDIGVSVDSILFPDMPIALRLSSHLLLGVVRIYSKQVNYLFDDCSEALLKIKQAFRSAAVDLPPEESTAPYHSITLPETFDLDDFELPESDIFLGNYVDHHISAREQITLQDTMEGVVYSTSQFGLDERFGDGDTSGLDLDEELFMNKVTGPVVDGNMLTSDVEGQPSNQMMIHDVKEDEDQDRSDNSEQVVPDNENEVGQSNLDDHAQAPPTPGLLEEPNLSNIQEVSACEDRMEVEELNLPELEVEDNLLNATSKCLNDVSMLENECQTGDQEINKLEEFDDGIDKNSDWNHGLEEAKSAPMLSHDTPVLEPCNISDNPAESLVGAVSNSVVNDYETPCRTDVSDNVQKPFADSNVLESNAEIFQQHAQSEVDETLLEVIQPPFPQEHGICSEPQVEACMVEPHSPTGGTPAADSSKLDALENVNFDDTHLDGLDRSNISEFPAPEILLSVPEEQSDPRTNLMVDFTPNIANKESANGDDVGTKQILGKKRTFTESTVTVQSLSSVESYEPVQSKRTMGSIPDDDDLLSSILVGRKPSTFKLKPSPAVPSELTTQMKRPRIVGRTPASKKRVLMDDTMVLHGDMIRQQLMSTEDIRRQRKKAPCTRREICMIQKDFLEDDIFMEPVLTGLSTHFVMLHSRTYNLSKINIYKSGATNMGEAGLMISNDRIEHPVEGGSELINAAQTETEVINGEEEIIHGSHAEEQMNNPIGVHGPDCTTEELTNPTELETLGASTSVVDFGPVFISTDQLPPEALDNTAFLQVDTMVVSQEQELGDGESSMLENEEKAKDEFIPEGTQAEGSIENFPVEDGGHGLDYNPGLPENEEVDDKVENWDGVAEELIHNVLNPNLLDFDEEPKIDTLLAVDHDMDMTHAPMIDSEYRDSDRTDPSMVAEITPTEHPAMEDNDFNYLDGHDTEFLNVDDDDAFENDDDCIPNGEQAGQMENSGWSTRTRSVAKYLQTLFDKEEIPEKRVLSMDNLLVGRTRKEASRMFFETLVLKSKDYIEVQQGASYDNINIMPKGKLMKSDF